MLESKVLTLFQAKKNLKVEKMSSFIKIMHLLRKYGNSYNINEIIHLATYWLFDDKHSKIIRRYARFIYYINYGKIIFAHNH